MIVFGVAKGLGDEFVPGNGAKRFDDPIGELRAPCFRAGQFGKLNNLFNHEFAFAKLDCVRSDCAQAGSAASERESAIKYFRYIEWVKSSESHPVRRIGMSQTESPPSPMALLRGSRRYRLHYLHFVADDKLHQIFANDHAAFVGLTRVRK